MTDLREALAQPVAVVNTSQGCVAETAKKEYEHVHVTPRRDVAPDDAVWLNIYCSVANCSDSEKHQAVAWADAGLAEFKKRFHR